MLEPRELPFPSGNKAEELAQPAGLARPGDGAPSDQTASGIPDKTGYPDPVYVLAANIFQGIRIETSPEKVLIKYGNEPLRPLCGESEDESFQHLSYELAFSALKCE